jgi:hypothetical protein
LVQDAQNLLQLAAEFPFPDLLFDEVLRALKVGTITGARDKFIQGAVSLGDLVLLPMQDVSISTAQRQKVCIHVTGLILCR